MEEIQTIFLKTEELQKRVLFAPILKNSKTGTYYACLTHTAIDRDDEIVGKKFMDKSVDNEYLPALMDHENKALGQVAVWIDKRVERDGNEYAFVAVPKFFLSNPSAVILKGMLDEGAQMGISITAIPSAYEWIEKAGKKYKMWSDGEIVSADFVGIQAQKYAKALLVAKSFNLNKNCEEEIFMTPEEKIDLKKELSESFDKSLSTLTKTVEDLKAANDGLKAELEVSKQELVKMNSRESEREKVLSELNKKMPDAEPEASETVVSDDVSAGAFAKLYAPRQKQE